MEENWYAVEQQIRDRLNEARAAARTRALILRAAPKRCQSTKALLTGRESRP